MFYRSEGWLFEIPIEAPEAGSPEKFRPGLAQALFPGTFKTEVTAGNQLYDIAADGQRFLMIEVDDELRGPDRLHIVLDFARELSAGGSGGD